MRGMLIAGVQVSLANVARLAHRVRHDDDLGLSSRIGFAVDMNRSEFRLYPSDREKLLRALGDGPDEFDELRVALRSF